MFVGDLVRCRLHESQPWRLAEVGEIRIADPLMRTAADLVDDVDLDDPPAGKLVWITYRDRGATAIVLVRCGSAKVAGDHEVMLPGDQMIEARVWSAGKLWTVRLWEGGKVRIDPCVTDSEGKTRILDAKIAADGTIALDQPVDTLPGELLEDCAWALDHQMGSPRWRREHGAGATMPAWLDGRALPPMPPPAVSSGEQGADAAAVLRDLLGRLGLGARAVRLKNAPADKIRDEIVAWVAGLNETALVRKLEAVAEALRAADFTVPDGADLAQAVSNAVDVRAPGSAVRPALLNVLASLGGDAETLGINGASEAEIQKAIFAMSQHLEERARVGELEGVKQRAGIVPQTRQWADDLVPQLRAEVDTMIADVRAAAEAECLAALREATPGLLPEVEVACPHCQGGMLITPDLLRPPPEG